LLLSDQPCRPPDRSLGSPPLRRRYGRRINTAGAALFGLLGGRGGADPLQRTGNAGDALGDALRGDTGEGEAEAVLASLDHEVGTGGKGDALALRPGKQSRRAGSGPKVEPEEEAPAGDTEFAYGVLAPHDLA